MLLPTITGDIVQMAEQGKVEVLIHNQNCWHGWKKGIVVQIAESFPEAKEADLLTPYGSKEKLGTISVASAKSQTGSTVQIVNMYGQFSFGQGNHINYEALKAALEEVNKRFCGMTIHYPMVGAGQAGGDWERISAIINDSLTSCDHQLVKYL